MAKPTLQQVIGEGDVQDAQVNIQEKYDGFSGSLWKSVSKESYNVGKPVKKEETL